VIRESGLTIIELELELAWTVTDFLQFCYENIADTGDRHQGKFQFAKRISRYKG